MFNIHINYFCLFVRCLILLFVLLWCILLPGFEKLFEFWWGKYIYNMPLENEIGYHINNWTMFSFCCFFFILRTSMLCYCVLSRLLLFILNYLKRIPRIRPSCPEIFNDIPWGVMGILWNYTIILFWNPTLISLKVIRIPSVIDCF